MPPARGLPVPEQAPEDDPARARTVLVAWRRMAGWVERYEARHRDTVWDVSPTLVRGRSEDRSTVSFAVPVAPLDDLSMDGLVAHLGRPWQIGVLLVRRGGFAVARLTGAEVVASKVGQRHVQGRTKAGGWSQQRFARRRDNQARAAYDAAGSHASALLLGVASSLDLLALGGDRQAADAVLAIAELAPLARVPRQWLAGLPDPKRGVLDHAVEEICSVRVEIVDTAPRT